MSMGKSLRDMEKFEFMIALKMKQIPGELVLTPLLAYMFLDFFVEFYLVSGVYEEASTSLSNVLHKFLKNKLLKTRPDEVHVVHDEPT